MEGVDFWELIAVGATVVFGAVAYYYYKLKKVITDEIAKYDKEIKLLVAFKTTIQEAYKDQKITKEEMKDILIKADEALKAIEAIWDDLKPKAGIAKK